MGEKCSKLAGSNYSRQCAENPGNPFVDMDNLSIEQKALVSLNFYSDFEKEFPVLRHFNLSDYMNLLSSFRSDREMNPSNANDITEEYLSKEDWMRFFDNKIIKHPTITRLNVSQQEVSFQNQLWDDLFDDVKNCFSIVTGDNSAIELPKSLFFAIGYLYCKDKISQKLMIMCNLFSGADNKIILEQTLYISFFLIFANLIVTPVRVFDKFCGMDMDKSCYLSKIKTSNVIALKNVLTEISGCITDCSNKILDILFPKDDVVYTKDEFRKRLMEPDINWILSNNRLRAAMEERMREKGISV